MKFNYGQYDGQPFPTPDSLFASPKVMEFILHYGEDALDALSDYHDQPDENEQIAQMIQEMIDAGLLEKDEQSGRLKLTPKMVHGMEHRALMEIFENMRKGTRGEHGSDSSGRSDERIEGTKSYEFGDKLSEIDLTATMRQALKRQPAREGEGASSDRGGRLPIRLEMDDIELHQTESVSDTATCVLIDLSGSMMRYGRFYQAKQVALGLASMVRQRYPQDTVDFVGFYSLARHIPESDLPLVMPKPVSVYDPVVKVRLPLEQAQALERAQEREGDEDAAGEADAGGGGSQAHLPLHFTNLQLGLREARKRLARRGAANKQIFIITDGQPTAHVEPVGSGESGAFADAGMGEMLYLLYPPSEHTSQVTLREALRCQQQQIRLATFALIEDYWGMDWVGFVDRLTRLTRGSAFYCSSGDLSSLVIESYLSGKKRKSAVR